MKLACLLLAFSVLVSGQQIKQNKPANAEYKVGQKWSYNTRPGEEKSYLIILKIDDDAKLGRFIHVAVQGLKIKNPRSPEGVSDTVGHMPFSEEAINKSGLKLLKEKVQLPDFEDGYRMWRKEFDQQRAGIYSITVADAVGVIETSLQS